MSFRIHFVPLYQHLVKAISGSNAVGGTPDNKRKKLKKRKKERPSPKEPMTIGDTVTISPEALALQERAMKSR